MPNPVGWRLAFPLTLAAVAVIFALYFDTARSIVDIWIHFETFTHGFIIVPISLWLIWKRRDDLAQVTPRPSVLGLMVFVGVTLLWLLGKLSGAQVVMQYAFVAMFPTVILAMLGWRVFRPIAFPLLFLLLAVPFGDAFIDPMINITADITVAGLKLSGIPVLREGNVLTISSGVWSVVEACSGVRYLIASITLGIIYAYLTYRSRWRQIAFVIASVLVPVLANGLRAYMIVMIGHLSDMKYAVGVDHLIYGWLFFGVVMLLLFWVGNFWREDDKPAKVAAPMFTAQPQAATWQMALAMLVVMVAAVTAPWYNGKVEKFMAQQSLARLTELQLAGWEHAAPFSDWLSQYKNPSLERMIYLRRNDQLVGLYVAYYRNQNRNAEMIRYGNALAMPGGDKWRRMSETVRDIPGFDFMVRQNMLWHNKDRLLAWYWYWTGEEFTSNAYLAKARLAWNRLMMRPDDSAVIAIFAPYKVQQEEAEPAMQKLAQEVLPELQQKLVAARQH